MTKKQKVIIPFLILLTILFFVINHPDGMTNKAWRTANLAIILAVLWMTETIPITVTSLLPIILIPLFGIEDIKHATSPYANELVFLFMGGFFIAAAIEKVNLHRRFAMLVINKIGFSKKKIILSFMFVTTFLSMWISNTATVLIMLPMALSVINEFENSNSSDHNFEVALLLAIAYSASIGGIATLIGTPPNAFTAAFLLENYKIELSFVSWMIIGVSFSVSAFIALYFILRFQYLNNLGIKESLDKNVSLFILTKKISSDEIKVLIVFIFVAVCWVLQPFLSKLHPGITDTTIAITGAILLFLIPSSSSQKKILLWSDAEKISWGILILFGGGLSLANVIQSSGLALWIGNLFEPLKFISSYIMIFMITTAIILLTELTSNLAITATFIPIVASIATGMNENVLLFVVPSTIAASCAFMLPVGTPPNAIIFASNRLKISEMIKTGIFMIIFSIIFIMTVVYFLLPVAIK